MRILLITDTHVAPGVAALDANWSAAAAYARRSGADLTIHLGDVTADGVGSQSHFDHARRLLEDWPTPWRVIPGNHDVGDNPPQPGVAAVHPLRPDRLSAFRGMFGDDHWTFEADGWRLIGLNAQLFGSGSREEDAQSGWLEQAVAGRQPTILFLHKPLVAPGSNADIMPSRYVPVAERERLLGTFADAGLRLVVSGHVHQSLERGVDGVRHSWLPSASFILPDPMQDRVGEKIVGLGILDLGRDGYVLDLVCPDGLVRHDVLALDDYPGVSRLRDRYKPPGR